MTIDDQIIDEKLQYDINRKAAKTLALSLGKIDKYEYLTGEEILPFNQKSLGKAFEKQTKTIEDQGEKQIKPIQNQVKTIKEYTCNNEDSPLILKQKEIFNKPADEWLEEISSLDKKVNPDNFIYKYKGPTADAKFDEFDNALNLVDKIRKSAISLADAKNNQIISKSSLGEIKKVNKKHGSEEQKNTLYNIEMHYKARDNAIKFFDDYFSMIPEAKHEATKGIWLQILTPKQMLQRLSIALAKVKAGNNSENLLNEIRQTVYSLYQSKEIAKKAYNNIIKPIQI